MNYIEKWMPTNPLYHTLTKIIIVFIIVVIINLILRMIIGHLSKKTELGQKYTQLFYDSIGMPLRLIFWLVGIWYVLEMLTQHLTGDVKNWDDTTVKFLKTGILLLVAWAFLRFFVKIKQRVIVKTKRTDGGYDDFSKAQAIERVGSTVVVIITALTIMGIFAIPMAGILTVGGIGGAAIAFANQQLIANIFSGFAIFFDRPFSVGDWIYTTDQKVQGTVEKIGLRLTVIRGFDKRPVYVPNSTFNTAATVNASRMTNRRIYQFLGLRYADFHRIEQIFKDIRDMLKNHSAIDQNMLTLVNVVNGSTNLGSTTEGFFGSSSINFMVYTFTKTTNWVEFQNIQDDIILKIGQIILNNNAEIAFSTTTLDFQAEQALNVLVNG